MVAGPKHHVKIIIDNIVTTRDNGVTAAQLLFEYEYGPEDLDYLFFNLGYDAVITIGDADPDTASGDRREIQDVPVHFTGIYPVTVFTVDKYDAIGNLICTATKLQTKITLAIRAMLATTMSPTPPITASMKMTTSRPRTRRVGGLWLWIIEHRIEYFELNP